MTIHPAGPGSPSGARSERAGRSAGASAPDATDHAAKARRVASRDLADISGTAKDLALSLRSEKGIAGHLDPARERQILDRIVGGFYDRPEVGREVVEMLADQIDADLDPD